MVRPARPNETPQFGQVWRWGDSEPPLMCIGPGGDALRRNWRFLDLDDAADIRAWYWFDSKGQPFDDWTLIDE